MHYSGRVMSITRPDFPVDPLILRVAVISQDVVSFGTARSAVLAEACQRLRGCGSDQNCRREPEAGRSSTVSRLVFVGLIQQATQAIETALPA